jgi:FtsH-binding integral membrane protein
MSEVKTSQHDAPSAGAAEPHGHAVDLNKYIRTCAYVFVAVICATALMIWISFLPEHYTWALKVGMILVVACGNAFVVAGFLMHLISEKKMIYTLLAFTVFFFAGLMGLTLYALHDFPTGTTH